MNDDGPSCRFAVDIAIESPAWEAFGAAAPVAEAAIAATLRHAGVDLPDETEISLLLSDDAFIRTLNRQWRGQDKPTNVLSFPAAEGFDCPVLGDIAIAYETTAREAAEEGKDFAAHFSHLVVHGLLHLLGHDHEEDAEAEGMEDLERAILAELGIEDPYRQLRAVRAGASVE